MSEPATVETLAGSLPERWKMAIRVCPYCAGTGERGTHLEPDSCAFCGDTGDLIGHMLTTVYAMGQDDGLRAARTVYVELLRAGKLAAEHDPPAEQLKARLGL